jgi:nucleotide-binding universal stress UspA family protein
MPSEPEHWKPKLVLVAFDDVEDPTDVIEAGAELAAAEQAELTVLQVVSAADPRVVGLGPAAMAAPQRLAVRPGDTALQRAAERAREHGVRAELSLMSGDAADVIVEEANRLGADLVVVPSHRRTTLADMLFGDVSSHVVKHAKQSVLVIRKASEASR